MPERSFEICMCRYNAGWKLAVAVARRVFYVKSIYYSKTKHLIYFIEISINNQQTVKYCFKIPRLTFMVVYKWYK